jgi:hypothetical protein
MPLARSQLRLTPSRLPRPKPRYYARQELQQKFVHDGVEYFAALKCVGANNSSLYVTRVSQDDSSRQDDPSRQSLADGSIQLFVFDEGNHALKEITASPGGFFTILFHYPLWELRVGGDVVLAIGQDVKFLEVRPIPPSESLAIKVREERTIPSSFAFDLLDTVLMEAEGVDDENADVVHWQPPQAAEALHVKELSVLS